MVFAKLGSLFESIRFKLLSLFILFKLKPNHLTLVGGIVCIFAGLIAGLGFYTIAGFVFLFGSLLDAFDGALARRINEETKFGAFLDSVTDRLGEGTLLLGVLYYESLNGNSRTAFIVALALFASLLVSYVRARGESLALEPRGGIAPRQVRVPIMVAALFLPSMLQFAMLLISILSFITVIQRSFKAYKG